VRGWDVVSADQRKIGEVDDLLADPTSQKVRYITVELNRGAAAAGHDRTIRVPISRARLLERDKHVVIDVASSTDLADFSTAPAQSLQDDQMRLTRAAEELRIGKRRVPAGEGEGKKRVETQHVREAVTLHGEEVDVQRRPVTGASSGDVQISAQEVRVPIYEEEAIIEKRPVVKEEVVISKRPSERTETVETDVREEHIDVEKHRDEVEKNRDVRPTERDRTRG